MLIVSVNESVCYPKFEVLLWFLGQRVNQEESEGAYEEPAECEVDKAEGWHRQDDLVVKGCKLGKFTQVAFLRVQSGIAELG